MPPDRLRSGGTGALARPGDDPAELLPGSPDLDIDRESDGQSGSLDDVMPGGQRRAPRPDRRPVAAPRRTAGVLPRSAAGRAPEEPAAQRALLRRIGADGLLGLGWPVEYGGQGRGPEEQFVFFDEAYRAGAPVSMVTLNTVGPTLMKYGTPEQKDYFLPRILRGDTVFAIGYSEPGAARTSPRCAPAPYATEPTGSSTGRRSSPPTPRTRTGSGSPAAPIPTPPSTRASRSSWCPPTPRASPGRRSTRSAASRPRRRTTTPCACPPATSSAPSTAAGD